MNIILILLKFLFLSINTNILCEKIKLKSFKVKSNHLIYFNNFIFNNYSSENPIKQGLNYSLKFSPSKKLKKQFNSGNYSLQFYLILIKSKINIQKLKNLCNSNLDENYLKKISFLKSYNLTEMFESNLNITNEIIDGKILYEKGVFKTIFLYCKGKIDDNNKYKEIDQRGKDYIYIKQSYINYYNTDSYESSENFYRINLYILITIYYVIVSIYWIYKCIINYDNFNLIKGIFSLIIPLIIFENIFRLQFYRILKNDGEYILSIKSLEIIFRILKNVLIRIIIYLILSGYIFKNKMKIIFNNILEYITIIVIYFFFDILYEISLVKYESDFLYQNFGFYSFMSIILLLINIYIWLFSYINNIKILLKGFEKKNFHLNIKFLNIIQFMIIILEYICYIYFLLSLFVLSLTNSFAKVYFKWMEDLTEKFIGMFIFLTLSVNLWSKFDNVKDYVFAIELNENKNFFGKIENIIANAKKKRKEKNNNKNNNIVNNKINMIKEVDETENEIEKSKENASVKLHDDTNNDESDTK